MPQVTLQRLPGEAWGLCWHRTSFDEERLRIRGRAHFHGCGAVSCVWSGDERGGRICKVIVVHAGLISKWFEKIAWSSVKAIDP